MPGVRVTRNSGFAEAAPVVRFFHACLTHERARWRQEQPIEVVHIFGSGHQSSALASMRTGRWAPGGEEGCRTQTIRVRLQRNASIPEAIDRQISSVPASYPMGRL